MRALVFLISLLVFASCKKNENCIQPPCAKPNINAYSNLFIEFCVSESDPACYLSSDLTTIQFKIRNIATDALILDTMFNEFGLMSYTIPIGSNSEFEFGEDNNGIGTLLYPENYFEIKLETNSELFEINEIKFKDGGPCSCPSYVIESVEVNDIITYANQNRIIIKK